MVVVASFVVTRITLRTIHRRQDKGIDSTVNSNSKYRITYKVHYNHRETPVKQTNKAFYNVETTAEV